MSEHHFHRSQGVGMIFVFGSNEAGVYGAGVALYARRCCSAEAGMGFGPSGNSFAVPTKDHNIKTLPFMKVSGYVKAFVAYAKSHPDLKFKVTAIACGLAGFRHDEIAPLFVAAPNNCSFDEAWKPHLGEQKRHWGTFQHL
jgi:hypothetical protein